MMEAYVVIGFNIHTNQLLKVFSKSLFMLSFALVLYHSTRARVNFSDVFLHSAPDNVETQRKVDLRYYCWDKRDNNT